MGILLPATARHLLWIMLVTIASASNANEEALLELLMRHQMKQQENLDEEDEDTGGEDKAINFKIKDIASHALVVFDKNCTQVVQPFKLTDNFDVLQNYVMNQTIGEVKDVGVTVLTGLLGGQRPTLDVLKPIKKNIPKSLQRAAQQLNWLPMTAEVMYGERLHKQEDNILAREHKLGQKYYPIADKMLEEILSTVNQKHDYEFKLFILKNNGGNAIARPGGFLYIDQGLLDDPNRHPKAYFALAHELAHVLQRHETKELQSMIIDSIPDKELWNVVSKVKYNPEIIFDYLKVRKDRFTAHHVDQELQSDSCAVKLLDRVFVDDNKLTNSIQVFLKDLEDLPATKLKKIASVDNTPSWGKTANVLVELVDTPLMRHPSTMQRTDNLKAMYGEVKKRLAREE